MEMFKGIDLNDSFVLNWELKKSCLRFEIEASVWPVSEFYSEPKENEYTCYRASILLIKNIETVEGLKSMGSVRATTGLDGTKDYGNIDVLETNKDGYFIEGEFGSVKVFGGELCFEICT